MARLIDGDALKNKLEDLSQCKWNIECSTTWGIAYEEIASMVADAQIIDAVEVVRCKDCKYKHGIRCSYWDGIYVINFDYCSKGEKRDVEDYAERTEENQT